MIPLFVLYTQRARLAALGSAGVVACDAVVEDQVCGVVGRAEACDGQTLEGPASGQQCVWYRLQVTQWWWDPNYGDGFTNSREMEDRASEAVFVLRDPGGQILVDPRGAEVDRPVESFSERRLAKDVVDGPLVALVSSLDRKLEQGRKDEELEIEEWILPPDEELYVRGKACRAEGGLMMVDPEDGHFVISTRSKDQLARSQRRWAAVTVVVCAAAAAAGVALIVAGALG